MNSTSTIYRTLTSYPVMQWEMPPVKTNRRESAGSKREYQREFRSLATARGERRRVAHPTEGTPTVTATVSQPQWLKQYPGQTKQRRKPALYRVGAMITKPLYPS
jgi:hypothetical protein